MESLLAHLCTKITKACGSFKICQITHEMGPGKNISVLSLLTFTQFYSSVSHVTAEKHIECALRSLFHLGWHYPVVRQLTTRPLWSMFLQEALWFHSTIESCLHIYIYRPVIHILDYERRYHITNDRGFSVSFKCVNSICNECSTFLQRPYVCVCSSVIFNQYSAFNPNKKVEHAGKMVKKWSLSIPVYVNSMSKTIEKLEMYCL